MDRLQIEIPEGHVIDQYNSDLSKGVIKFKKIKVIFTTEDGINIYVGSTVFVVRPDRTLYEMVWEVHSSVVGDHKYFSTVKLAREYINGLEPELPTRWEELGTVSGYYIATDSLTYEVKAGDILLINRNVWPTKKLAEASIALAQLCQLRDRYNDGWVPNWTNSDSVLTINCKGGKIVRDYWVRSSRVLFFRNRELRDKFFKNFKDLLEIAKPLL